MVVAQSSTRVLPGRAFTPTEEIDVQASLPALAARLPGVGRQSLLITECVGPHGVPDLVVLVGGAAALERRLASGVPPLTSELDAQILVRLNAGSGVWLDEVLAAIPASTPRVIERRMSRLERVGAIRRTRVGAYLRRSEISPFGRTHALEAKVSDWGGAIGQALGYASWCDSVSVVLGRAPRRIDGIASRMADHRLGLAIGGEWIAKPAPRPVRLPAARRLVASEFILTNVVDSSAS